MLNSRFLLGVLALSGVCLADQSVSSPDKAVDLRLTPKLEYTVRLAGKTVLETSPVGIVVDGVNLSTGGRAGKSRNVAKIVGCNGIVVRVDARQPYELELYACNDGVAFRHIVPGRGTRTPDEATAFRVPAASTVWYHDLEGHYEALHRKQQAGDIAAGQWLAPPVTWQLPSGAGYAAVTEAALYRYAGMALQADGKGAFVARLGHSHPPSYPFRLRYKDDVERLAKPAPVEGTITTPWRVVLVGRDLNALVNATLVARLSPAPDTRLFPQGSRTGWIKPGRAVWKYLDGGENTAETVREFSRLAAKLGFEYQVVEGFWQKWPKEELKAVITDARNIGVGLWLWKHSNQLRTPDTRKQFFDLCAEVGAAGVKIDFFDHEAKEVVELYEVLLREAAERKLLVNFHGANKPTGESHTWPNELTREAVRGMESRKSDRAAHDATVPFTRLLAGPADYTPVHFGERRNDTTWAHQIATAVVMTSGLLTYGAHPKSILENPSADVMKSIPAVWDETRVLPGSSIGELALIARRTGKTWFVAGVNGPAAKNVLVELGFLPQGNYAATIVRDVTGNRASVNVIEQRLGTSRSLTVETAMGGGFVMRLIPASSR